MVTASLPRIPLHIFTFQNEATAEAYVRLTANKPQVYTMNINNPEKLDAANGLRITLVNSGTEAVDGAVLINQLRFTQTQWIANQGAHSKAEEIFPAEDPHLMHNAFSQRNEKRDAILHPNRTNERTLKCNISSLDNEFELVKPLSESLRHRFFKELGFYLYKPTQSNADVYIELRTKNGMRIKKSIDYTSLISQKWHEIKLKLEDFSVQYYDEIRSIALIVDNYSHDDFIFFIDELFLEQAQPSFAIGNTTNFSYSDPQLHYSIGNLPIFAQPYVSFNIHATTRDFLKKLFASHIPSFGTQEYFMGIIFH